MNSDSELDIRRDANGQADIKYYTELAHALRAQQLSRGMRNLSLSGITRPIKNWFTALLAAHERNLLALRVYGRRRLDGPGSEINAGKARGSA